MSSQAVDRASAQHREASREPRRAVLDRLFAPVDNASLVFFRVAFGAIMLWEVCRYFYYDWVEFLFVRPTFRFAYYGFDWLALPAGGWMRALFLALGVLAVMIAVGALYRLSMVLFFVGFSYVFLFDQSLYLNHFYLICLVSLAMVFVPAHRAFSVDAWLRPGLRSNTAPAWALALIVVHVAIAYFYGGLAKLNGDWLGGEPMRTWLAGETGFLFIGRFFTEEWMVYLFSYGGLLLDLLVVPFLLWRRTRPFAFAAAVAFHLMNADLFQIGIFPFLMIAATLLFFPPSWPRQLAGFLRGGTTSHETAGAEQHPVASRPGPWRYAVVGLLGLYLAVQLLVPFRHHLYPGDPNWTEEGHRFSWHMKLRDKQAVGQLVAVDPTLGTVEVVRPRAYGLSAAQASDMFSKPDMILQFAHHVAGELRQRGWEDVQVRALVAASLNGRDPRVLIDPKADLAAQRRTLAPADWILPLQEPLDVAARGDEEASLRPPPVEYRTELRRAAEEGGLGQLLLPGGPLAEGAPAGTS